MNTISPVRRYVAAEMQAGDLSGALFDHLRTHLKLPTDKALADWLEVDQPSVCRVRKGRKEVGPSMILRIHEKAGIPVARIRELLAGSDE